MNSDLLHKMWIRILVGAMIGLALAKPFADWMYLHGYWRYRPTIVVDHPTQLVEPLEMPVPAAAHAAPAASTTSVR